MLRDNFHRKTNLIYTQYYQCLSKIAQDEISSTDTMVLYCILYLNIRSSYFTNSSKIYTSYLLKLSKAILGALGMLQFHVADWNGQKPVVNTRTNKSTPCRVTWGKTNLSIKHHKWPVCSFVITGLQVRVPLLMQCRY